MSSERLRILSVSQMPASPPRCGAQARMHGLLSQLARRHEVTAVTLIDDVFDADECRRAMQSYCSEVLFVRNPFGWEGTQKRLQQLRSLTWASSFERTRVTVPELQRTLDRVLRAQRFDIVDLEFPYLGHYDLRQAPPGQSPPALIVDSHNIEYDLTRQCTRRPSSLVRRVYAEANWRKLQREELGTYRAADGVYLCSAEDERRLIAEIGGMRTAVIPNGADVEFYQPRCADPPPDGCTVLYFGLLSTAPNLDGVTHFTQEIWPRIAAARPNARWKIVGARPPPSLTALAGNRIEFTGFVPDLRPHLAAASVVVVPLRLGGGTRLKIVEAMAMGKPIVSTALGAEGIDALPERDILIADEPENFAASVIRLLDDASLRVRLGKSARRLAVERYSWTTATASLERFFRAVIAAQTSSREAA